MPKDRKKQEQEPKEHSSNEDQQGVDKAPGEEQGMSEKVKLEDLKGKKVDRDPSRAGDEPLGR
ncbi:MAG TPA: hypothetical protein VEB63_06650 [Chitinophagaceae bacterium]|nr:hypothetical protein [Chitinophagaceae bacterium]